MGSPATVGRELISLPALGSSGEYIARQQSIVPDVAGVPMASLSMVPALFVTRTMAAMHKAESLPPERRYAAISSAVEAFASDEVAGLPPHEYRYLVSRVGGLPISMVDRSVENIAVAGRTVAQSLHAAKPAGACWDWTETALADGGAVWIRRGDVFAVHAAGNSPGVHAAWLQALALGYRVAVRPSRREPFTPFRLITALRAAGFGADQVALLPTDYTAADEILGAADLAMVYGGEDVVKKYAGSPKVLPQGPGRSKILITSDVDWRDHLDMIVSSASRGGGTGCMNTTAIFVQDDPASVAQAIAERLGALPSLPPEDDASALPVRPMAAAKQTEQFLLESAQGTHAWLGGDGIVDELPDGSAVLRPAVHELDSANDPRAGLELPFPCVWVAPWSPADGIAPLRRTLALTVLTGDTALISRLASEPAIANLNVGSHPTYWSLPDSPHDDYLPTFLMRAKAFIGAA
jgi:acyl-CoA reductase-like NAD-dependent aldehyde dehydrogenase